MSTQDRKIRNRIRNPDSVSTQELQRKPIKTTIMGVSGYDARIITPAVSDLADEISLTIMGVLLFGALGAAFIWFGFGYVGIALCVFAFILFLGFIAHIYIILRSKSSMNNEDSAT